MAINPMQRKARNSFLLGMLVMLLIASVIIGFLVWQLMERVKKEAEEAKASVNVYVLKQDVKSGQEITSDMLVKQPVLKNMVPGNATSDSSTIENSIAKIAMKKNTVITNDLVTKDERNIQKDLRKQEYNMLVLPMDLETGDWIDIRIAFPSGQDYIVTSKKEVEIPNIGGIDSEDTIWINMTEDEILHMSCAIVDAYQVKGSKLYVTKYTEAGLQEAAIPTYPANESTLQLLQNDPNIVDKAMNAVKARYSSTGAVDLRNKYINDVIQNQGDQAKSNLESNMDESIRNSKNARKEYLESLGGNY